MTLFPDAPLGAGLVQEVYVCDYSSVLPPSPYVHVYVECSLYCPLSSSHKHAQLCSVPCAPATQPVTYSLYLTHSRPSHTTFQARPSVHEFSSLLIQPFLLISLCLRGLPMSVVQTGQLPPFSYMSSQVSCSPRVPGGLHHPPPPCIRLPLVTTVLAFMAGGTGLTCIHGWSKGVKVYSPSVVVYLLCVVLWNV